MGARRRAEQFASAVDGRAAVERLPAEVRELVDVVDAVRTVETPAPRPEFSAALREQLMAEAQTALAPATPLALPARRRGTRERRLTAAAAVFTLVGGTAGIAVAAQDALPGEALYPIKRGIEDAQLSLQTDADARGRTYLEQASDRLVEADRLVEEGASSTAVAETVDSFVVQAVAGADLLLGSFEEGQSDADVQVLREFAADALGRLQALAEAAPADIQDELARAAVVLQRIDQQAAASCADCSSLPPLEMPVLMSQAAEISRAMEAVRTSQELNNDHPALDVKLPQPTGPRRGDTGSDDGGTPSTTTGGDDPQLSVTSPGQLPPRPQEALEQLDQATGGLLGQVTDTTEKTVEELEKELDDAVDSTVGDTDLLE
jgi:hypothetical protein